MTSQKLVFGKLAEAAGQQIPLAVHKSGAGYYIGTWTEDGPFTRESVESWPNQKAADAALQFGHWTQRRELG